MFLGNTKPFFDRSDKNEFYWDFYLKNFNLIDYGQDKYEFENIYDSDSRVERYLHANMDDLPNLFILSGRGQKTRDTCGRFKGIRSGKFSPTLSRELMFTTCNKLSCPVCVRKAANVKALKIVQKCRDYIWFCITQGITFPNLRPKHFTFNPLDFKPNLEDMKKYHESIKKFIERNIQPYLMAGIVFYHHHRFKTEKKETLKEFGHFHVIGFGYMPDYKTFFKKHNFIYTNEGYLNTLSDIFRVARYELTHVIFPRKKIVRKTKRTHSEIETLTKHNEWQKFLGLPEVPITEYKESKSIHSFHSYFYFGYMSPYNIRKLKERKIFLPMRHVDTNEKMYEIIDGVLFRKQSLSGRYKYYTIVEMYDKGLIVDDDLQVKFFKSKLKWGKLFKQSHWIRWIKIKNFHWDPDGHKKNITFK